MDNRLFVSCFVNCVLFGSICGFLMGDMARIIRDRTPIPAVRTSDEDLLKEGGDSTLIPRGEVTHVTGITGYHTGAFASWKGFHIVRRVGDEIRSEWWHSSEIQR